MELEPGDMQFVYNHACMTAPALKIGKPPHKNATSSGFGCPCRETDHCPMCLHRGLALLKLATGAELLLEAQF
jgi:hypothetical protein